MGDTVNYIDLLDRVARSVGNRNAIVDNTGFYTHSDLSRNTNKFANALIKSGFVPETAFAVLSPNTCLAFISLIGGIRAGGAWSNINVRSGTEINIDLLTRGGCRALFFHSSTKDQVDEIVKNVDSLDTVICLDQDMDNYPSLENFIRGTRETHCNIHLASTEVGFQGSTGGTTGAPKITQAGQTFLTSSALGFMTMLTAFDIDRPPVNLAVAPITHAGGFVAMATLAIGGTVILMDTTDPSQILSNIPKYNVSLIFFPPTLTYVLMNHAQCSATDFSSLRYLISAAAPFAVEKIAAAHRIFGPVVSQAFGQTESGFPLTFMSPDNITAALENSDQSNRLKSIGRPTAIVGAMDVMNEEGELLGPNEVGEIVVRGPTVMFRYLNDPEATVEIQKDGWQRTGDLGYRDEDGFFYINDRKRDLIITGGFNVFPLEVEQTLLQHPAVQDCAVIGVPDEKWGEAVKAIVELAPGANVTEQVLISLCKETLGSVMAPKSVDFIDVLPRSPVGKVLKRDLRKSYWRDEESSI